jgi:branched-chain amino acid transport system ATP-binding protein
MALLGGANRLCGDRWWARSRCSFCSNGCRRISRHLSDLPGPDVHRGRVRASERCAGGPRGSARMGGGAAMTLLDIEQRLQKRFGGLKAVERGLLRNGERHDHGAARSERIGQDHTAQPDLRAFRRRSSGKIIFNDRTLPVKPGRQDCPAGDCPHLPARRILPSLTCSKTSCFRRSSVTGPLGQGGRAGGTCEEKPGLATGPGQRGRSQLHRPEAAGAGPRTGRRAELLLLDEWLAGLNPTELQEGISADRSLRAPASPSSWSSTSWRPCGRCARAAR